MLAYLYGSASEINRSAHSVLEYTGIDRDDDIHSSALAAFETVYRVLSISLAANELALTQSAVSKKIQLLETFFGQALFVRNAAGLQPTAAAEHLWEKLPPCLDQLEAVMNSLRASRDGGGTLNLAVVPTFASKWLLPRFPTLQESCPALTVNLNVRLDRLEFVGTNLDVGIVFGTPGDDWRNCEYHLIMEEKLVPVCGPSFIQWHGRPNRIEDIKDFTLMHQTTRLDAWHRWFGRHGITVPEILPGPRFELFSMITEAAKAGLGIALLPELFVAEDIRRRKLIKLFDAEKNPDGAYYLVYPTRKASLPGLKAFKNWLLGQTGT
mgnify:CR=1 FL=1